MDLADPPEAHVEELPSQQRTQVNAPMLPFQHENGQADCSAAVTSLLVPFGVHADRAPYSCCCNRRTNGKSSYVDTLALHIQHCTMRKASHFTTPLDKSS